MLVSCKRNPLFFKRLFSSFLSSFSHYIPIPLSLRTSHSPLCSTFSAAAASFHFQLNNHCIRRTNHDRPHFYFSTSTSSSSSSQDSIHSEDTSMYSYLSVRIRCCSRDVADLLSEALLFFGAGSTSIDEVENSENIDEIYITSIFPDDKDVYASISHASDSIGLKEIPSYEVVVGEQRDWIKNSQEMFQPVKVTDNLWIVPEWRTVPNSQAINIFLNPGLAFGTGEHPTTKLCLLLLHGLIKGGEYFLDYGTGSGILGIAALKLGAALSIGIDNDPQALSSARQNAALNNMKSNEMPLYLAPEKVSLISPFGRRYEEETEEGSLNNREIMDKESFDIVIANILLNPLIELADHIVSFAKPGAVVGVSGIISEQIQQIESCYSRHLDNLTFTEMDGWACMSGIRKKTQ